MNIRPTTMRPATAATLLFERLPETLFQPLASTNRLQYWQILCMLHDRYFGPEAALPPAHGFSPRELTRAIQDAFLLNPEWQTEDDALPDTPRDSGANNVFKRLVETGWLHIDQHGVEKRVTMRPAINQFLNQLVSFATDGPIFVAGKIRSIDFLMQDAVKEGGDGTSITEAAKQTRSLLEHIRNTGTNVRELMEALGKATSTADFVQRFFLDYVERVFIGDYRELRTREHPLARRGQILSCTQAISDSATRRAELLIWYEKSLTKGNRDKAQVLLERDLRRLFDLEHIDDYLNRLDDEIRRANKRALAFLDYRLRSQRPVDSLVAHAVRSVMNNPDALQAVPFFAGELMGPDRLAEPRVATSRAAPTALRQVVASPRDIARAQVMLRARMARSLNRGKLTELIQRYMGNQSALPSEDFPLDDASDVVAFQTLLLACTAMNSGNQRLGLYGRTKARGFDLPLIDKDVDPNAPITGRPFQIEPANKSRADGKGIKS